MKHIFIIHSHTLFLSSLGIINKLAIEDNDILFLFHRHYKTIIPFNYKWIDISDEFENTYKKVLSIKINAGLINIFSKLGYVKNFSLYVSK